jgi:hypothetical protein
MAKSVSGRETWKMSRRSVVALLPLSATMLLPTQAWSKPRGPVPIALRGYDPVAYFTIGKPTLGSAEFEYLWDEHVYRFSRAEHRDLFKADPVRYAPQFANFCAMALARGEIVEADPGSWLISEGKLYVFAFPIGVERFQQGIAGNVSKANGHRPLIINR